MFLYKLIKKNKQPYVILVQYLETILINKQS